MFVSPKGGSAVLGLVGVYMWLQTWPIAYVLINYATSVNFQTSIDTLVRYDLSGMEEVYALWDQVRHSYAVSQSLLGMTPIITGALLTGSMMMLTKLGSKISGSENFDESRVHRNTESASPKSQSQASLTQYLNADGTVRQS